MADVTPADKLRDIAEHRGLKLVKSRKRKPGTGDYGKFGLTDVDGKPLLGIGEDGLTATPEDIETYLRQGATSTWKASAENIPERAEPESRSAKADDPDAEVESAIRPRGKRATSGTARATVARSGRSGQREVPSTPARKPPEQRVVAEPVEVDKPKKASVRDAPAARPELIIRAAKSADAAALAPLLHQLARVEIDELGIARNLEAVRKARGGMAVAELGELVGFCSWAVIATVQHGPVGRLTLLLVDKDHRRRGIATALLDAATSALRKIGCSRLEAMSDIEIANAHGFFRTLKFEQTSYRFARDINEAE